MSESPPLRRDVSSGGSSESPSKSPTSDIGEASSTRPNPFDESISARKRRRTYGSSPHSPSDSSDSGSTSPDSKQDHTPPSVASSDSGRSSKTNNSLPGSLEEPSSKSCEADPVITISSSHEQATHPGTLATSHNLQTTKALSSSCVTINTRPHQLEQVSGDHASNTCTLDIPTEGEVSTSRSDEFSSTASFDMDHDSIMRDDGGEPVDQNIQCTTSTSDSSEDMPTQDPSFDFPLYGNKTAAECIDTFVNCISSEDDDLDIMALTATADWMNTWVRWAKSKDIMTRQQSLYRHEFLWVKLSALPRQFMMTRINKQSQRQLDATLKLVEALSQVTACMIESDVSNLPNIMRVPSRDGEYSLLNCTTTYISTTNLLLDHVTKMATANNRPYHPLLSRIGCNFLLNVGFSNGMFIKFLDLLEIMIERKEFSIEIISGTTKLVHYAAKLAMYFIGSHNQAPISEFHPQAVLEHCHTFHNRIQSIIEVGLQTNRQGFKPEPVLSSLVVLGLILELCHKGQTSAAKETTADLLSTYPDISINWIAGCMSTRWKFSQLTKMVISGQMALCAKSISAFSSSLVTYFENHSDSSNDPRPELINFVACQIRECGIIDYFYSPIANPDLVIDCYPIIGFLAATHTLTQREVDRMWNMVSASQNPRSSDAVLKMATKTVHLFEPSLLIPLVTKLSKVALWVWRNVVYLEFAFTVLRTAIQYKPEASSLPLHGFRLCLKWLCECLKPGASFNTTDSFYQQALTSIKEAAMVDMGPESREILYQECFESIRTCSDRSTGSYMALVMLIKFSGASTTLQYLVNQHGMVEVIVNDLAWPLQDRLCEIIRSVEDHPRQKILQVLLTKCASEFAGDVGSKIWDLLVGPNASLVEDRTAGWKVLNGVSASPGSIYNEFLISCFPAKLHRLPIELYTVGMMEFIRLNVRVRLNNVDIPGAVSLDQDFDSAGSIVDMVWKVFHVGNRLISDLAAELLAEIYTRDKIMLSDTHSSPNHLYQSFLSKCLQDVQRAHQRLEAKSQAPDADLGPTEPVEFKGVEEVSDWDPTVELTRSLRLLRTFVECYRHRIKVHSPEVCALLKPDRDVTIPGNRVKLLWETFDENCALGSRVLEVSKENTVADVLHILHKQTKYPNFCLYHDGLFLHLTPKFLSETVQSAGFVGKTLTIKKSEILEKQGNQVEDIVESTLSSKFETFYKYLELPLEISSEVYELLAVLPVPPAAIDSILDFKHEARDVFPPRHAMKSAYAIHAIRELASGKTDTLEVGPSRTTKPIRINSLERAMVVLSVAVNDDEVVPKTKIVDIPMSKAIATAFIDLHIALKRLNAAYDVSGLDKCPVRALVDILEQLQSQQLDSKVAGLFAKTFEAVICMSVGSHNIWKAVVGKLMPLVKWIFRKPDAILYRQCILIIERQISDEKAVSTSSSSFAKFIWILVSEALPVALEDPVQHSMMLGLVKRLFCVASLKSHIARHCIRTLLSCHSSQHVNINRFNPAVSWLVDTISACQDADCSLILVVVDDDFCDLVIGRLLFQRTILHQQSKLHGVVTDGRTRRSLYRIMYNICEQSSAHRNSVIKGLGTVMRNYHHLERNLGQVDNSSLEQLRQGIRSPCGYVGLENLHSTCYINSLVSQLFMNVEFRRLILTSTVTEARNQGLLQEMKWLFSNMQNSFCRSIRPDSFIYSILTYEGGCIDPRVQMDADEFFNLLVDRLESQFADSSQKSQLKGFFEGQLVQQIKGMNCGHVSERSEPFSAIQCDVQGKASLHDSLQAYISGELMDGDNKYRCSTCQEDVDAVKRACFQSVPDNLIFHLKRFEFNIQTMERSKINDHFTFPQSLDMSVYTAAYLNNPDENPALDMFELVGVLVHSGVADSGHYYSFIRERPALDVNKWVQFNDDDVQEWNPDRMEMDAFGGIQELSDQNGNIRTVQRYHSAYMLFYQRASVLKANQAQLDARKVESFNVPVPTGMSLQIEKTNKVALYSHCLSSAEHLGFMSAIFMQCFPHKAEPGAHNQQHASCMQTFLTHISDIVRRTDDMGELSACTSLVSKAIPDCADCALLVFGYFSEHVDHLYQLMVVPSVLNRQDICGLMMDTLKIIKDQRPDQYVQSCQDCDTESGVLHDMISILDFLWQRVDSFAAISFYKEYFDLMVGVAQLGELETVHMLSRNYLLQGLRIMLMEERLCPAVGEEDLFHNMSAVRRHPQVSRLQLTKVVQLICLLLEPLQPGRPVSFVEPEARIYLHKTQHEALPWTRDEWRALHFTFPDYCGDISGCNVFIANLCQHELLAPSADCAEGIKVVRRMSRMGPVLTEQIMRTIEAGLMMKICSDRHHQFISCSVWVIKESEDLRDASRLVDGVSRGCIGHHIQDPRLPIMFFVKLSKAALGKMTEARDFGYGLLKMILLRMHEWAPWLLFGHQDFAVGERTRQFIQSTVLTQECPEEIPEDIWSELKSVMQAQGCKTALACAQHVQQYILLPNTPVYKREVDNIMNMMDDLVVLFDNSGDHGITRSEYKHMVEDLWDGIGDMIPDEDPFEDDEFDVEWEQTDDMNPDILAQMQDEMDSIYDH